jgi:hypothetical protein
VVAARILVEQLEMNTPQATARLCVTGHLTRQVGLAVSHAVGRSPVSLRREPAKTPLVIS